VAINKLNSKFKESLGTNKFSRAGTAMAGMLGVGAFAYGAFKFIEGVSWNSAQTVGLITGGGALTYGVINKIKYGEDVTFKQTRHISYVVGGLLVGASLLPPIVSSGSESSNSKIISSTTTTTKHTDTITSNPPGMCEISIPYISSDTIGVKKMQAALNEVGIDAGPVDGINGSITKQALRTFKLRNGFDPAINFNEEMCTLIPSLVDGDLDTPNIGGGN